MVACLFRSVLVWDLATQAPTAGPQCPAPITSLLYVEQWLLCGLQTGGITAHHTGGSGGAVELAGHTGAVSPPPPPVSSCSSGGVRALCPAAFRFAGAALKTTPIDGLMTGAFPR